MQQEIWIDISNYEGLYKISNLGKYNKGTHKYKGVFWFRKEIEN